MNTPHYGEEDLCRVFFSFSNYLSGCQINECQHNPWKGLAVSYYELHLSQVKSSHLYLYIAFNNTNCVKATAQYQNRKIVSQ